MLFIHIRYSFSFTGLRGPALGPRPTEKHNVEFTDEQMRAGQSIIGLQAGTNKCASQAGKSYFFCRSCSIIQLPTYIHTYLLAYALQCCSLYDDLDVVCLLNGKKHAGMNMGGARHIADIKVDKMAAGSEGIIGLQSGSNKGASQAGMSNLVISLCQSRRQTHLVIYPHRYEHGRF